MHDDGILLGRYKFRRTRILMQVHIHDRVVFGSKNWLRMRSHITKNEWTKQAKVKNFKCKSKGTMVAVKRRRKAAIVESDSVCHGCKERGNFTQSTSRTKKNNNNFRTQQECCKASYAATFSICNLHFGRHWFLLLQHQMLLLLLMLLSLQRCMH